MFRNNNRYFVQLPSIGNAPACNTWKERSGEDLQRSRHRVYYNSSCPGLLEQLRLYYISDFNRGEALALAGALFCFTQ